MKTYFFIFLLLILSVSAFGFITLLNDTDFKMEQTANANGPALISMDSHRPQWESYNQWQCFSIEQIKFDCATYDETTLVPSMTAENETEVLFFDVHVEENLSCKETLYQWQNLVFKGNEVCVYAAHMFAAEMGIDEISNKPISLWYISQIKGFDGYWKVGF